jgi:hypothetical protein
MSKGNSLVSSVATGTSTAEGSTFATAFETSGTPVTASCAFARMENRPNSMVKKVIFLMCSQFENEKIRFRLVTSTSHLLSMTCNPVEKSANRKTSSLFSKNLGISLNSRTFGLS